jgi:hypothetical protein
VSILQVVIICGNMAKALMKDIGWHETLMLIMYSQIVMCFLYGQVLLEQGLISWIFSFFLIGYDSCIEKGSNVVLSHEKHTSI